MANELQRLTDEVKETASVIDAATKLIGTLAQKIRDNAGDPTALNALADQLDAKQNELAAAVAANTAAEGEDEGGGLIGGGETEVPPG